MLKLRGISGIIAELAIAITDNTLSKYSFIDDEWLKSNPKGYAEWFKDRMKVQYEEKRMVVAKSIMAKAEDVPEYKVKTTLQRSIQLLKRHRDIMFRKSPEDKPISMIITTLAAHAYNNEANLHEAIRSIVQDMPDYILTKDGFPWIPNPVNPDENFADKWKDDPKMELNFRRWIIRVEKDLESAFSKTGIHRVADRIKPVFGDRVVNEAFKRMGDEYRSKRQSGLLKMSGGTGMLGTLGSIPLRDHTFYGS